MARLSVLPDGETHFNMLDVALCNGEEVALAFFEQDGHGEETSEPYGGDHVRNRGQRQVITHSYINDTIAHALVGTVEVSVW